MCLIPRHAISIFPFSFSFSFLFLFLSFFFFPFFLGGGLIFPWYIGGRLQNAFCRAAPFSLLRRIATLDLSEWLPNRTQQVGRMAKGPSYMFFDACAGTILHRRLLRFEPTFLARRPARWLLSSRDTHTGLKKSAGTKLGARR